MANNIIKGRVSVQIYTSLFDVSIRSHLCIPQFYPEFKNGGIVYYLLQYKETQERILLICYLAHVKPQIDCCRI